MMISKRTKGRLGSCSRHEQLLTGIQRSIPACNRAISSTLEDMENRYNKSVERTALLEQELVDKARIEEELQRTKDELRGQSKRQPLPMIPELTIRRYRNNGGDGSPSYTAG